MIRRLACAVAVTGLLGVGLAATPASAVAAEPSISLVQTVSTDVSVCGTSSSISVPKGTEVFYCYTMTNNTGYTLSMHTISDDTGVLGDGGTDVAPGESYTAVPAAFVALGPIIVNSDTAHAATWKACVELSVKVDEAVAIDPPCFEASATASVTVTAVAPTSIANAPTTATTVKAAAVAVTPHFTG